MLIKLASVHIPIYTAYVGIGSTLLAFLSK